MTLLADLRAIVGEAHVLNEPDLTAPYAVDWTRRFVGCPAAVVRPGSTAEVVDVVQACRAAGVSLVPQGGNTGLVGGGVPRGSGMVVLSLRRLDGVSEVDVRARQVTAGAGVTIARLHDHAAASGLGYGVDLAARDTATVGGTVATNAGGLRVVRHGDTRRQVLGVQAVLADGSVVEHLHGLPKDSAGYDLSGLLVGSEGTLGVVTAARLRLVDPPPAHPFAVLVGCRSLDEALRYCEQRDLLAAEFVAGPALELVSQVTGLPYPLQRRWPFAALLETAAEPELPGDVDAVIDPRVWTYRERQTEAIGTLGMVHKLDVAVPLDRLDTLVAELPALATPHQVHVFGHLREANLHVEVVGPEPDDNSVDERVLRRVAELGGSISAEHGIGVAKASWLSLSRSQAEIAAMRRVKYALDPHGLLNPGVLLT